MGRQFKIIFILIIMISCKNNSEKKSSSISEKESKDSSLQVIIKAEVLKDDVFEVYYYEKGDKTFTSYDFVSSTIEGKPTKQEIVFKLPDDIYPERLRLDFGKNSNQDKIKLYGISLSYDDKTYAFSEEEIKNKITPSKFIDFDSDKKVIRTRSINGKYDPYFYTFKVSNIINYLLED